MHSSASFLLFIAVLRQSTSWLFKRFQSNIKLVGLQNIPTHEYCNNPLKNFKCQSCNCLSLKWRLVQKLHVMRTRSNVLLATLKGKQKMSAVACCNIHVLLVTLEGKQKMPAIKCIFSKIKNYNNLIML